MSVIIDGFCVIVKNERLEEFYPGGVQGYREDCTNRSFCTDGTISRIMFMTPDDAGRFVGRLEKRGFIFKMKGKSRDIAVVDSEAGFAPPCDWLALGTSEGGLMHCWLAGREPGALAVPEGWTPEPRFIDLEQEEFEKKYRYLRTENGVDLYDEIETGEQKYIGRSYMGHDMDLHFKRLLDIGKRLMVLGEEETRVLDDDDEPDEERRARILELYREADELKVDEGPMAVISHHICGLALRVLERWEEAADEFRKVISLQPESRDGWLELTWCLVEQEKYNEADLVSKQAVKLLPDCAAAWGNRAIVMVQLLRRDEAQEAMEKALALDPDEEKARYLSENFEDMLLDAKEVARQANKKQ